MKLWRFNKSADTSSKIITTGNISNSSYSSTVPLRQVNILIFGSTEKEFFKNEDLRTWVYERSWKKLIEDRRKT